MEHFESSVEDTARLLEELGLSLIPVHKGQKVPALPKWNNFVENAPEATNALTFERLSKNGDNYGIRTGKDGGCVVVDLDLHKVKLETEAAQQITDAYVENAALAVKTPNGGYHAYFSYDDRFDAVRSLTGILGWIDLLVENKQVVGPGSMLTEDHSYQLLKIGSLTPMPQELYEFLLEGMQQLRTSNKPTSQYSDEDPLAVALNCVLETTWQWKLKQDENGTWCASPASTHCLVREGETHTKIGHSCFLVSEENITAYCYSHGAKPIKGKLAEEIRTVFFPQRRQGCRSIEDLNNKLLDYAKYRGLVRRKDGYVWEQDAEIPWNYHRRQTIKDYVDTVLLDEEHLKKAPRSTAEVLKYMLGTNNSAMPFLQPDRRYLGFRNGILDLHELRLIEREEFLELEERIVPRHYIPQELDMRDDPEYNQTPHFDALLLHQLPPEIALYLQAFIGRLFYRVREKDHMDVIPMIKGDTGTGKSTVLNIIKVMFAPNTIDVLNSNMEDTFGLQSKYNKELLLTYEVSDKMFKNLSADVFKQIACGETISVPIKGETAQTIEWSVPLLITGNSFPPYKDVRGSISRRMVIFKFESFVSEKNASLEQKILEHELPAIIINCLRAYKVLVNEIVKDSTFEQVCPAYFTETLDAMKEETDYLYIYLTAGIDDNNWTNGGHYYRYAPDKVMALSDFKKKYSNWLHFNHNIKMKWSSDYSTFNRLGYVIFVTNSCKNCYRPTTELGKCCELSNSANRSKKTYIKNIECVERTVESERIGMGSNRPIPPPRYT